MLNRLVTKRRLNLNSTLPKLIFTYFLISALNASTCFSTPCEKLGLKTTKFINTNGKIAPKDYRQIDDRSLIELLDMFGMEFAVELDTLKESEFWFDSGSAYHVAIIEALMLKPFRAVALNAQDFYTDLFGKAFKKDSIVHLPRNTGTGTMALHEIISINGIGVAFIESLARLFRIKTAPLIKTYRESETESALLRFRNDAEKIREKIFAAQVRLETEPHFTSIVGMLQDRVPEVLKYQNQIKLLTDSFGPLYYSANRVEILKIYMMLLGSSGKAFVSLGGGQDFKPKDIVLGHGELFMHLVQKFPEVFKISRRRVSRMEGNSARPGNIGVILTIDAKKQSLFDAAFQYLDSLTANQKQLKLHDEGNGFVVPYNNQFSFMATEKK